MERDNGRNFLMVTNSISWITTEKAYFILSFYGREMNYYDKRATDERAIELKVIGLCTRRDKDLAVRR